MFRLTAHELWGSPLKSAGAPQDGARPKETDPDQNKLREDQ